ncbi:hypothetical protein VF10_21570, partial [Nostoc linckia z13]
MAFGFGGDMGDEAVEAGEDEDRRGAAVGLAGEAEIVVDAGGAHLVPLGRAGEQLPGGAARRVLLAGFEEVEAVEVDVAADHLDRLELGFELGRRALGLPFGAEPLFVGGVEP